MIESGTTIDQAILDQTINKLRSKAELDINPGLGQNPGY